MANIIGQSLGRYHILEQLGEGGMATVYKAYDTRLERNVAIKIIRRGAFPPDQLDHMLKRFEREAKSLAKLSNPNIVKVMDYGEHEGAPYLVMEYLPGNTLRQQMGKPMPWQDSVRMLLPIAEALEYAHEHNIIHRDIKPANILLTEKGQPMLSDFGIAKILESDDVATLTGTGVGVGTPEYMAPEQWTGQSTAQSDIYSLGVVLYEMVSGRKPYSAETPVAILLKQASEPLPRLNQFVSDLPESVENILIKALAKAPQDRYENMASFVQALHALQVGRLPSTTSSLQTSPDAATLIPTLINEAPQENATVDVSGRTATPIPALIPAPTPRKEKQAAKPSGKLISYGIAGLVVLAILVVLGINLMKDKPSSPVVTLPSNTPTSTSRPASTVIPSATFTAVISTNTTAPTIAPTSTVTPIPFEPSQWRGAFRYFGSLNPVNFIIDEVNGLSFTGAMYWQFTQCRVTERVEGDIIYDITTATEQNRWALHPDFQSGDKSGTWLRWTQNESIGSTVCYLTISGDWWYAHINSEGHMVGIHFTNSTNTEPDTGATFDFTLVP